MNDGEDCVDVLQLIFEGVGVYDDVTHIHYIG